MNYKKIICFAPHPDDETLGCGGTLLRAREEGDEIYWLIVTNINEKQGFTPKRVKTRRAEIERVSDAYGFSETIQLNFQT